MTELTSNSYEGKAKLYAESVDTRPFNAYYERPGLTSLLPPLAQKTVLDVGCGNGWYAEYLVEQGAVVTAFDVNIDFVQLTRQRLGRKARVMQADMAEPLHFAANQEYDLVLCPLTLHYIKEWQPTFREFYRVLKPTGKLLFSTHHPLWDWQIYEKESYFDVDLIEDEWDIGQVLFYRRPLTVISQDLQATGFTIERLLEPPPVEEFRQVHPDGYEKLLKMPWFLFVRAQKNCDP